jgi:NAD(P)-dependent dehydrogenase (short-subunit alcohol dehydrogenase family)
LAETGYDIIVHYSSSEAGALETKSKIEALGRSAYLIQSDLIELYAPRELISEIKARHGRLDLLVNSASTFPEPNKITSNHSLGKETEEEWEESISVNSRAPFFLTKYAAPLLKESKNGLVVNILDESIVDLAVSRAAHTISKNALKVITELSAETFGEEFKTCALLLGNILPGEKMSKEEVAKVKWVGVQPVLDQLGVVIESGISGMIYEVR